MDDIFKEAFGQVRKELRDRVGKKLLTVTVEQPENEEEKKKREDAEHETEEIG